MQLYVYGIENDQLSLQRWNYKQPYLGREKLLNVGNLASSDRPLQRCLKQFLCDERTSAFRSVMDVA